MPPTAVVTVSESAERTAKWLVGDQLSCVLHLGDSALAYRLSAQGHEVLIAGDDARVVRNPQVQYVRTSGERLPFASASFDAIVAPHLDEPATTLAEFARVLTAHGLVSTLTRAPDDSIPWVRKLREIVGSRFAPHASAQSVSASGLFHEPEIETFAVWEELDLAGVMQFAHETGAAEPGPGIDQQIRALFASYASHAGFIRLRHETRCLRARVRKDALPPEPTRPATTLFDFS